MKSKQSYVEELEALNNRRSELIDQQRELAKKMLDVEADITKLSNKVATDVAIAAIANSMASFMK